MTSNAFDRFSSVPEGARALARASLRSRVLGVLHRCLDESDITQTELADRLGIRKSAVHRTLNSNGNLRVDTIADMLAALDLELYVCPTALGEVRSASRERRRPVLLDIMPSEQRIADRESLDSMVSAPTRATNMHFSYGDQIGFSEIICIDGEYDVDDDVNEVTKGKVGLR